MQSSNSNRHSRSISMSMSTSASSAGQHRLSLPQLRQVPRHSYDNENIASTSNDISTSSAQASRLIRRYQPYPYHCSVSNNTPDYSFSPPSHADPNSFAQFVPYLPQNIAGSHQPLTNPENYAFSAGDSSRRESSGALATITNNAYNLNSQATVYLPNISGLEGQNQSLVPLHVSNESAYPGGSTELHSQREEQLFDWDAYGSEVSEMATSSAEAETACGSASANQEEPPTEFGGSNRSLVHTQVNVWQFEPFDDATYGPPSMPALFPPPIYRSTISEDPFQAGAEAIPPPTASFSPPQTTTKRSRKESTWMPPPGTPKIPCEWDHCGAHIFSDLRSVVLHVQEYHLGPAHITEGHHQIKTCKWGGNCTSSGYQRSNLRRHLGGHLKTTAATCPNCGQVLSRKDARKRHMDGCCTCRICRTKFGFLERLAEHSCPGVRQA